MEKIALITGSSRGIGRAVAAELAHQGYAVCINYRVRKDCADDLAAKLTAEGCRELRQSAADVHCGALLLPGEEPLPQNLRAESVVTYGLSHRDTLTLSSLGEMPVLCLQRRLSASGEIIDARELPLTAQVRRG